MNARLDKPERWIRDAAGSPILAVVRCAKPDARGAFTCRGQLAIVSTLPVAALPAELRNTLRISRDLLVEGTHATFNGRPYVMFEPGWGLRGDTWSLTPDTGRRRALSGSANPRRADAVRRRLKGGLEEETERRKQHEFGWQVPAGWRPRPARIVPLPVRAICPECHEPQEISVDLVEALWHTSSSLISK